MYKRILLILFLGFSFLMLKSQEYPWEDISINITNPEIMKNSKFTIDEFGRIYFIGNNGIIYYVDKSDNWFTHWVYNGSSDIKARENSALLSTPNYLYYVGTNNEVCCYYWNSSNGWQNRVLNTSFRNVMAGTNFTIDENGRIYYVGDDGYIYYINRNVNTFTSSRLIGGSGTQVRSYSNIIYHANHVFYVGTNNEICNYWWNNNASGFGPVITSLTNVISNTELVKDKYGRIFWIAENSIIHCIHWSNNNWISYWWMPEIKVDGNNGFIYHDEKFYYTYQNKIGCIFWNGSESKHQILNQNSRVKDYTYFEISANGDLIYFSANDKKIHLLSPKIYWEEQTTLTSSWKDSDGTIKTNTIKKQYKPKDFQLYPRDLNNKGTVQLKGHVFGAVGITVNVKKESYTGSISNNNYYVPISNFDFNMDININAELSEYEFNYKLTNQTEVSNIASRIVCGDIYAISGQSNAESSDLSQSEINTFNCTYGENSTYGKYSRTYNRGFYAGAKDWGIPSLVTNNWGFKTGVLGLYLQYLIQSNNNIPVCIVNDAFGATAITEHTPLNGQNPYFFETGVDGWKFGHIQGHLNTWLKEIEADDKLKGYIWWQGEAETSQIQPLGYYKTKFSEIHNSLNGIISNEFNTYVIQVHAFPAPESIGKRTVCEDQRTMNEYINGSVINPVSSNGLEHRYESGHGIHFTLEGYKNAAKNVFYQLEHDIYGKSFSKTNLPLNIENAFLIGNTLYLQFNQNINAGNSDNIYNILNAVKVSNSSSKSAPNINGNLFSFNVSSTNGLDNVSYLGVMPNSDWNYACHLRNEKNIGALSFSYFPIQKDVNMLPSTIKSSTQGQTIHWDVQGSDGADKSYKFFVPQSASVNATLCSNETNYDAKLEIFNLDGSRTGYYNDDYSCSYNSLYSTIPSATLETGLYYFVVDGYAGRVGDFELDISFSSLKSAIVEDYNNYNVQEYEKMKADNLEDKISIYPNPANSELYIRTPANLRGYVQIFDISGKLMKYLAFDENINVTKIEISEFRPGIYNIRVLGGQEIYNEKLIVK
jgi:hypothetical protein